jgi:hypothetical protein
MTEKEASGYQPGQGLPPYLISRNYEDSSTESDGALRIFASTSCSTRSGNGSSSISQVPDTFSYMSTSSSFTWSESTSISMVPNISEHETSTVRSEILSMDEGSSYVHYDTPPVMEAYGDSLVKTLSTDSFMDHAYAGSFPLPKSYDFDEKITNNWDYDSTATSNQEQMLKPYVQLFSDTDDKRHAHQKEPFG